MSEEFAQPVFLDTTVISNFASTNAIDFLIHVLDAPIVVPAVQDEIEQGVDDGHEYLTAAVVAFGDGLVISDAPPEIEGETLRDQLDRGETAALRGAVEYDGTIATDDLAARRLAEELGVPVTGSVGLLFIGVKHELIDVEIADEWLKTWREERGFFAPVESVTELLDVRDP